MTTTKLSRLAVPFERKELPSTRTEQLLADALASDDITLVKAELEHVWAHYQSLEYFLTDTENTINAANLMLADDELESDLSPVELVARLGAGTVIEQAYKLAHSIAPFVSILGFSVPDAVRAVYATGGPLPTAETIAMDDDVFRPTD